MRVLILAVAFGACYRPDVADCQYRCNGNPNGTDNCPDGTACINNFCQVSSTDQCSGIDAPPPEALMCASFAMPAPIQCRQIFDFVEGGCGVLCSDSPAFGNTERPWNQAKLVCDNAGWQLGVLDTAQRLLDVPDNEDPYWVGASPNVSDEWQWIYTMNPVADAAWPSMIPPVPPQNRCAVFDRRLLSDNRACADDERFICTTPP